MHADLTQGEAIVESDIKVRIGGAGLLRRVFSEGGSWFALVDLTSSCDREERRVRVPLRLLTMDAPAGTS